MVAVALSWVRCTSDAIEGLNISGRHAIKGFLSASFKPAASSQPPTFGNAESLNSISSGDLCFFSAAFNLGTAFMVSASLTGPSIIITQVALGAALSLDRTTRNGPMLSNSESAALASSVSRCQTANLSASAAAALVTAAACIGSQ